MTQRNGLYERVSQPYQIDSNYTSFLSLSTSWVEVEESKASTSTRGVLVVLLDRVNYGLDDTCSQLKAACWDRCQAQLSISWTNSETALLLHTPDAWSPISSMAVHEFHFVMA
jgi:hypothetical protein